MMIWHVSCISTEGERFNARESSSYFRRNLTVVFMYHPTSSRFSFDGMCLSPFLSYYRRFFFPILAFACMMDDKKKRDDFFPFGWGYLRKSDLTVLERPLYLSDHPSPPPAKVRWLCFALRCDKWVKQKACWTIYWYQCVTWTQNKTTTRTQCWSTGYCTDVKNDVLSVNAAEFSPEREYEKGTGAKIRPAIDSGIVTGDSPVSYWPMFFPTTVPEASAKGPRTVVCGTRNWWSERMEHFATRVRQTGTFFPA